MPSSPSNATLKTVTLGCKVNQYETEFVREGLRQVGYVDAADHQTADLCIVNTCTVTTDGDAKSRQTIRRLARENPQARIIVMGCYATRAPEEIAALPGVSEVITDKRELPDLLGRFGVMDVPTGISGFVNRHRAFVKVQDGCLLRCSYCIIPYVRPQMYSRPIEHIVDETRRLVDNGFREIVLAGIHLGHYGVDFNYGKSKSDWTRLSHLVERLARLDGDFRIRLSSIEATEVTRELIAVMRDHADKVCPHLHVCLQSGSDRILRKMRRRWSSRHFIERCKLVREQLPHAALSTDVIVGFPSETEADFEASCQVSREVGFSKIHVFSFSARRGTPAADMADQVKPEIKADRRQRLLDLEAKLRDDYFHSLLGSRLQVLVEAQSERTAGHLLGTSCRYVPVELPGNWSWEGRLIQVQANKVQDGMIVATL